LRQANSIYKCIHLVPSDGVGGVEAAARSYLASGAGDGVVDLRVMYLAGRPLLSRSEMVISSPFTGRNTPLAYLWGLARIIAERPEVLICSLWRTLPLGILYKLLFPAKKLVCFLHVARSPHLADRLLSRLAISLSDAVWSDCDTTLSCRVEERYRRGRRLRSISFVLEHFVQRSLPENSPSFVFWGRLNRQKGLDQALRLFAAIVARHPEARYYIYGPDDGEEFRLKQLAAELNLSDNVFFMGPTSIEQLRGKAGSSAYYLQLSRYEGMAVSVVEAMQLGLVPVVTPVGEICNYCNSENAVVVEDTDNLAQYADRLCRLLDDDPLYNTLRDNSLRTWNNPVTYSTDIVAALNELLTDRRGSFPDSCVTTR
jgi:glycosyltransferase involved in cell wall biosynthesis